MSPIGVRKDTHNATKQSIQRPEKSLNTMSVQLYLARSRKKSTRVRTTGEVNLPFCAVVAGRDLFVMVRTSAVELSQHAGSSLCRETGTKPTVGGTSQHLMDVSKQHVSQSHEEVNGRCSTPETL